jgi:succinate dehydrogenase / fumarate reductase cytochrome b subunit
MKYTAKPLLSTTIGKKLLMAASGLFLCTFLVIHLIGNLQLFKHDDGLAFNAYAKFMTTNPLIKIVAYVNYLLILTHVFTSLILTRKNKAARPQGYGANNPQSNSIWSSRNMGILGTIILVFIVVHMQQFWYEYKFGSVPTQSYFEYYTPDGKMQSTLDVNLASSEGAMMSIREVVVKDLYKVVVTCFQQEAWAVVLYVLAQLAIAFHLWHGFASAFQTFGISHRKYTPIIHTIGYGFAVLIPGLFALMPLYFFFNH